MQLSNEKNSGKNDVEILDSEGGLRSVKVYKVARVCRVRRREIAYLDDWAN